MNNPKVSVVIPVYNGSNYLKEAIECALKQTYENTEIIVVNDGSNDDNKTEEIALSYGDSIRYFYKQNGGVSSALNYGISKMTGEYFSWLSHDDCYSENKIKDAVELLKAHNMINQKCIAFTGGHYIDINGKKTKDFHKYFIKEKIYSGIEVVSIMMKEGTLNGCCMLIPKDAFNKVGEFNESLRYSQDALMWIQMFLSGYSLVSDNKPNVMYRLHRNQTSKLRRDLLLHDSFEMSKIIVPVFIKNSTRENNLLRQFAARHARHECKDAVNECIREGRKANVLSAYDVMYLKLKLVWGKIRNLLKKIYLEVRIK